MAPPETDSISYAEAVKYAERYFPDVFRNLPPVSTIRIETISRSASFNQPPAKRYRIHLGHNKQPIPGSYAKEPIWFEFGYVAQDVERIIYNCCKDWSDDRAQRARAEWYGPFACIVASKHGNLHLCLVVLSLYYIMQSGHATSCAVHLGGSKTAFLGTFKEVCSLISATRPVPKPMQATAEWPTSGLHGNQIAFLGGLPQPYPSTNGPNPVMPAKRRPSDPRSAEYRPAVDEAPMIPSPLGFARPQKKTRPVPCASPLRAESDEQALKSIQQSLKRPTRRSRA